MTGEVAKLTCEKEIGKWTIRINGQYIACFWREVKARKLAMNLIIALQERQL